MIGINRIVCVAAAALLILGCSKEEPKDGGGSSGESATTESGGGGSEGGGGGDAKPAPSLDFAKGKQTWPVGDTFAVEVEPPEGFYFVSYYSDSPRFTNNPAVFEGHRGSGSNIRLSKGCDGMCQVEKFPEQIAQAAKAAAERDGATVKKPLTEVKPGVWVTHQTSKKFGDEVFLVSVKRIDPAIESGFLECEAALIKDDVAKADIFEKFCLDLTYTQNTDTSALLSKAFGTKYPLGEDVTLELPTPEGWQVKEVKVDFNAVAFGGDSMMSRLDVSMTCDGRCKPDMFAENIKKRADSQFESSNRDGRAKWLKPLAETEPGVRVWSIEVAGEDGAPESRLTQTSAIKDGAKRFFSCTVSVRKDDLAKADALESWCADRAKAYLAL